MHILGYIHTFVYLYPIVCDGVYYHMVHVLIMIFLKMSWDFLIQIEPFRGVENTNIHNM